MVSHQLRRPFGQEAWQEVLAKGLALLSGRREARFTKEGELRLFQIKFWLQSSERSTDAFDNAAIYYAAYLLAEDFKGREYRRRMKMMLAEWRREIEGKVAIKSGMSPMEQCYAKMIGNKSSRTLFNIALQNGIIGLVDSLRLFSAEAEQQNREELAVISDLALIRLRLTMAGRKISDNDMYEVYQSGRSSKPAFVRSTIQPFRSARI